MRWDYITRLWPPMFAVAILLGVLMFDVEARADSAPMAPLLPPVTQTSDDWWLDDGLGEVLWSQVPLLLVCVVECGLLVVGLEAFVLWRDRREKRKESRLREPGLALRDSAINS